VPTDLPHIIAKGVSTSVATAVAIAAPVAAREPDYKIVGQSGATVESINGVTIARAPNGATSTIYPPDAQGRRRVVARAANGATAISYVDARDFADSSTRHHNPQIDAIIEMKAVGISPEYIGAMRAAVPRLANGNASNFTGMHAVGVTPEFARDLVAAGFPSISADELVEARAVGLNGGYVRAMRAAGVRGDIDDFVQLHAVGVDPAFAARVKASGIRALSADDLVELKALGVTRLPGRPRTSVPPRDSDPDSDPDG